MRRRKEVDGELVVSGRNTAPVLDSAEEVLDVVPAAVDTLGTPRFVCCVVADGNCRHGAFITDLLSDLPAVVGFIGGDRERRPGSVQQLFHGLAVMRLSSCEREAQRAALAVDPGVDFCAAAASADADRLVFLPPFAPLAARCAFTMVLSIRCRLSRDFAAKASNTRFQMPRRAQRVNRL